MILELTLQHLKIPTKHQIQEIFGVDPNEIARCYQAQGSKGVRGLVHELIAKKLSTAFYNYEVVDWQFKDRNSRSASECASPLIPALV